MPPKKKLKPRRRKGGPRRISSLRVSLSPPFSLPSPHFVSSPLFPLTRHFVRERDFDDDEEEEEEGEEIKQEVSLYSPSPLPPPPHVSRLSLESILCAHHYFTHFPACRSYSPPKKKRTTLLFFHYAVSHLGRKCFCQFSDVRIIINAHNEPRFVKYGTIHHVHTRQEKENPTPPLLGTDFAWSSNTPFSL